MASSALLAPISDLTDDQSQSEQTIVRASPDSELESASSHASLVTEASAMSQALNPIGDIQAIDGAMVKSSDPFTSPKSSNFTSASGAINDKEENISPIGRPEHFPLTDLDMSGEDDMELQMQIELGELQAATLKRKIETKRRKRANASQSRSSTPFNLSAELSMQMEVDKSIQLANAKARITELERAHAAHEQYMVTLQQDVELAKLQIEGEKE